MNELLIKTLGHQFVEFNSLIRLTVADYVSYFSTPVFINDSKVLSFYPNTNPRF
jgi:hypothetical protein